MHGLVSLLDENYYIVVENVWKMLEESFGLKGIRVTPPFRITTAGLGLFSGKELIIYIAIVKNEKLIQLHELIYNNFSSVLENEVPYYHPNLWMPHISIAYSDLTKKNIGKVMEYLSFKDFQWDIEIDNLSFIHEPENSIGNLKYKFLFQG
ncbi:MAG: 2'-5' RNA ligase family protein [Candidatus Lokiarchaeota archaeon]